MQNGPEAMFSDWIQTLSLESSMNEIDSGKFLSPSLQRYGLGDLLLKIDRLKPKWTQILQIFVLLWD